jgi:hypothetical protein
MTDDAIGIWVQANSAMWHRSLTFDGYDHGLACDATLAAGDPVQDTQLDTTTLPESGVVCQACRDYRRSQDQEND